MEKVFLFLLLCLMVAAILTFIPLCVWGVLLLLGISVPFWKVFLAYCLIHIVISYIQSLCEINK